VFKEETPNFKKNLEEIEKSFKTFEDLISNLKNSQNDFLKEVSKHLSLAYQS